MYVVYLIKERSWFEKWTIIFCSNKFCHSLISTLNLSQFLPLSASLLWKTYLSKKLVKLGTIWTGTVDLEWFDSGQTCFTEHIVSAKCFLSAPLLLRKYGFSSSNCFYGDFAEFVPTARFFTICWSFERNSF